MSRGLGRLVYTFSRKHNRTSDANLKLAFGPDISPERIKEIQIESFQGIILTIFDVLWFSLNTRKRVKKYVTFDDSMMYYIETLPQITVTAHLGNWEVHGMAMALSGYPCTSIAAPLGNPYIDAIFHSIRKKTGMKMAFKDGAARVALATIKEKGRLAVLLDQNITPESGGIFVNFFGLQVPVSKIGASLAIKTKTKLVFTYCIPDIKGFYTAYSFPVETAPGADEQSVTQALTTALESVLRKHPGKWLWIYKRWKYIPEGADVEKYPFYARKTEVRG